MQGTANAVNVIMHVFWEKKSCFYQKISFQACNTYTEEKGKVGVGVMKFQDFGFRFLPWQKHSGSKG